VTRIRCYKTTGRPVFITVGLHRRIPYLKNLVGQVAPQALPDAYETTKFLFRFNRPFFGQRLRFCESSVLAFQFFLLILLGFVALNPTYILSVLLRNAKPNNGRVRNRVPKVSNPTLTFEHRASEPENDCIFPNRAPISSDNRRKAPPLWGCILPWELTAGCS